jgi:hypothetical protein
MQEQKEFRQFLETSILNTMIEQELDGFIQENLVFGKYSMYTGVFIDAYMKYLRDKYGIHPCTSLIYKHLKIGLAPYNIRFSEHLLTGGIYGCMLKSDQIQNNTRKNRTMK